MCRSRKGWSPKMVLGFAFCALSFADDPAAIYAYFKKSKSAKIIPFGLVGECRSILISSITLCVSRPKVLFWFHVFSWEQLESKCRNSELNSLLLPYVSKIVWLLITEEKFSHEKLQEMHSQKKCMWLNSSHEKKMCDVIVTEE